MKKWVVFLLGFLTGAIVSIVILGLIGLHMSATIEQQLQPQSQETEETGIPGMRLFDTPSEEFIVSDFKVFQVLGDGMALAESKDPDFERRIGMVDYGDPIVCLVSRSIKFYDDMVVSAPKGYRAMVLGTYKYASGYGEKTVPVIGYIEK